MMKIGTLIYTLRTIWLIMNGIVYEIKWLAQRYLLKEKSFTKSRRQDVDIL